jgi:hypothetical protein
MQIIKPRAFTVTVVYRAPTYQRVKIVACQLAKFSRTAYYGKSRAKTRGVELDLKRMHRLYCLEGLRLRMKMKVRRKKAVGAYTGADTRADTDCAGY